MTLIPLLLISDAPTAGTGLGRITSDLASRIAANLGDVYRVACLGYGGINSRQLPYHYYASEGMDGWIIPTLPEIWDDWAGKERGTIMFVSDPSRLRWFSRPEMCVELDKYPNLKHFLMNPPFQKWIYAPVDAGGPNDRLTFPLAQSLLGFDRILAYGKFGEDVVRRTLGDQESEKRFLASLPHGVNAEVFYPRNRQTARAFFFSYTGAASIFGNKDLIKHDETLIGIVATNQFRKDYGMALEAASILSRDRKIRLWLHTDDFERVSGWSIPALLADFGLIDRAIISIGHISNESMAKAYSACDLCFGIGPEGFGLPNAEALACSTPVITGSYAGSADFVPSAMQVSPVAFRYESIWGCKRPVYDAHNWAQKATEWIGKRSSLDPKYDWKNNWVPWDKWFREGVK
jgi:glycosyltransferase involved in cell wall biosynthesis